MKKINKFKLINTEEINSTDLKLTIQEFSHTCGLRHIHVLYPDSKEHSMLLGLETRPTKDDGRAHILEHLTLAGSKRYPKGDPFMSMISRSTASFINALTYPDSTRYPFASPLVKDFFNIAKVYCDAVWNPALSEVNFKREGWRVEIDPESLQAESWKNGVAPKAAITGIVFNEMKGCESDPSNWRNKEEGKILHAPNSSHAINSGGDPLVIPELTLEALTQFHVQCYHPSKTTIITISPLLTAVQIQDFLAKEFESNLEANLNQNMASQPQLLIEAPQKNWGTLTIEKKDCIESIKVPRQGQEGCTLTCGIPLSYTKSLTPEEELVFDLIASLLWGHSSSVIESCLEHDYGDPMGGHVESDGYHWILASFSDRPKEQLLEIRGNLKKWCLEELNKISMELVNDLLNKMESDFKTEGFARGYYRSSPATALGMEIFENVLKKCSLTEGLDQSALISKVRILLNDPSHKLWNTLIEKVNQGWLWIEGEPDDQYMDKVVTAYASAESKLLATVSPVDWELIAKDQVKFNANQKEGEEHAQAYANLLPSLELEDLKSVSPYYVPPQQVQKGWTHFEFEDKNIPELKLLTSLEGANLTAHEVWVLVMSLNLRDKLGLRLNKKGALQSFSQRASWGHKNFVDEAWDICFTKSFTNENLAWISWDATLTENQLKMLPSWWSAFNEVSWNQPEILKAVITSKMQEVDQQNAEDARHLMPLILASQLGSKNNTELICELKDKDWTYAWNKLAKSKKGLNTIVAKIQQVWKKLERQPQLLVTKGSFEAMEQTVNDWLKAHPLSNPTNSIKPFQPITKEMTAKYVLHQSAGNYNYAALPGLEFSHRKELLSAMVVSNWMSQKMVKKIREQGGAYGASSKVSQTMWTFQTYRDPRFEDSFNDIKTIIKEAINRTWTQEDIWQGALEAVKTYNPVRTTRTWATACCNQILSGFPLEWNRSVLKELNTVKPEDCKKVAEKYLSGELVTAAIVGATVSELNKDHPLVLTSLD